ncbi:hypothetical protein [Falsiroseomonas tokyonensis]|uniref:Uncharacterized protein n=1 Tax=Falsiroseomonas tokyonensis TaxID=430521 RepID=A0ABV7C4A6_9PROT|nr:hypothetical protein [Falsiroseomonas tokyonensis]MBU8541132.1 hypothetical protein [Falsiroseomonas tokyonensis]
MDHLPHGPFLVALDGSLSAMREHALRFAWRGRGCEASLGDGQINLAAQAGWVPFTAERPQARPGAFAALEEMPRELPPGWRLRLMPDHKVRLEAAVDLPDTVTATTLVSAMVGFALALDPYLDRLESAGMEAGAEAAGTVKT